MGENRRFKILIEGKRYTFSDYYQFNNPTEEILADLGYSLDFQDIFQNINDGEQQENIAKPKLMRYGHHPQPRGSHLGEGRRKRTSRA